MELFKALVIILHITITVPRKRHNRYSSSEESIENLLYYKDCNHKPTTTTTEAVTHMSATVKKEPDCPCPRMCCSLCCDCSMPLPPTAFPGRMNHHPHGSSPQQLAPQSPMGRSPPMMPGIQPQDMMTSGMFKRKKMDQNPNDPVLVPPKDTTPKKGGNGVSFTRENIKNLIAKDEDIKKILKDLVRVTMHKVDLKAHLHRNVPKETEHESSDRHETVERRDHEADHKHKDDDDYLED